MRKKIDKLVMELTPGIDSALIKVHKGDGVESFRASASSLSNLFVNRYSTGFLPVSQDGVLYLEERDQVKLVVVQRGPRENATITWLDHDSSSYIAYPGIHIPYLFGFFFLKPSGSSYRITQERIYCSSGGSLGGLTPLYDTSWMGNVYSGPMYGHSNVCWGEARIRDGLVSISSLSSFLNDFVSQHFNDDLGGSPDRWKHFSKHRDISKYTEDSWTMSDQIERMWNNERS